MTLIFLRRSLACALLAAFPPAMAAAAAPAPAARPVPAPPSALTVALQAVGAELQTAAGGDKSDVLVRFDRYEKFHFSAPTLDKLAKVFGDGKPASFERLPASGGARAYRFTLNPFSYVDPNGSSAAWTTLLVEATIDKGGRSMHAQGQWPSLDMADNMARSALRGMRFDTAQRLGKGGNWLGNTHATISSVSVDGVGTPFAVRMSNIAMDAGVSEHGALIDVSYLHTIERIEAAGQHVDDFHASTRMINLDYAVLKAFSRRDTRGDDQLTPQQRIEQMKPLLQALARSAVKQGSALVFDEISARFHGHKVSLSGRLGLAPAPGEFDSLGAVIGKLEGHLDLRVPVALLREIAPSLLPPLAPGEPARSPEATAQLVEAVTDGLVGKMLSGGYAKLDDGVLVSHIALNQGVVRANGKVVEFGPTAPPPPGPPLGQAPRMPSPPRPPKPALVKPIAPTDTPTAPQ